ncbi:MAG: 2-amino-4-hydroxy-6-hydroxymethyldihydropteridine diphosphokinase [Candidatus Omnitrophica bacterium]|nr:2-amino-4-hydroxy-6-hydroxymethyldihydropteridine diphosphokinase [Candidatus Omnitrophota bacterium]
MPIIYLSLGSNLGKRDENLAKALAELEKVGVAIEKESSIIETDPIGGPPQGKFFNMVLRAQTDLSPQELLQQIHIIEKNLGRVRSIKDGPRTIDIDILLYDDLKINDEDLVIPHPRMKEREFVMNPLREIEPERFSK